MGLCINVLSVSFFILHFFRSVGALYRYVWLFKQLYFNKKSVLKEDHDQVFSSGHDEQSRHNFAMFITRKNQGEKVIPLKITFSLKDSNALFYSRTT